MTTLPPSSNAAENTAGKQRGRPFEPGKSGNPNGRPKDARNRTTVLAEGLLDDEAEAITRKPIETNCATRSALWFRSVPTALPTLVVKLYRSGYGDYCCKQACGQRDPLPTLLTDIVEEPMPALDEMSGLEPAHVGMRNPGREI